MPPQQSQGLLDRLDQLFGFGAHRQGILDWRGNLVGARRDVNARRRAQARARPQVRLQLRSKSTKHIEITKKIRNRRSSKDQSA